MPNLSINLILSIKYIEKYRGPYHLWFQISTQIFEDLHPSNKVNCNMSLSLDLTCTTVYFNLYFGSVLYYNLIRQQPAGMELLSSGGVLPGSL